MLNGTLILFVTDAREGEFMRLPSPAELKRDWPAVIGIAIFVALLIAAIAGHYVVNPFVVGFAYYVVYAIKKSVGRECDADLLRQRLFAVSVIALLSMFGLLRHEAEESRFLHRFQETCYQSRYSRSKIANYLCEEIQSDIDGTIGKAPNDYD
jgi:hypothetical protein